MKALLLAFAMLAPTFSRAASSASPADARRKHVLAKAGQGPGTRISAAPIRAVGARSLAGGRSSGSMGFGRPLAAPKFQAMTATPVVGGPAPIVKPAPVPPIRVCPAWGCDGPPIVHNPIVAPLPPVRACPAWGCDGPPPVVHIHN
jgi:hypothetical protein